MWWSAVLATLKFMLNLISETNKNMVLCIIKGNNSRTINFKIKLTCILLILMSEWLIVAYLTEQFFSYIMTRTS
jgi:hypothetical protein